MKIHEESNSGYNFDKQQENLYEILDIKSSASAKEIKRQYTKLAGDFHPDKHPDCQECEAKFQKISHAYEVLSDEEKRQHYDQTEGVIETIKSGAVSIYDHSYHKQVLESPHFWVLQVFNEQSSTCQSFSGFWEEYIEEYDYIQFGRIHNIAQKKLLPKLPFAIDAVPFVFTSSQKQLSEVLEYSYDESPNQRFVSFLRRAIGEHHKTVSTEDVKKLIQNGSSQKTLFFIQTDNSPIVFNFYGLHYSDFFSFTANLPRKHKDYLPLFEKEKTNTAVFHEIKSLPKVRAFTNGATKQAFKNVLSYMKSTHFPRFLKRRL